MENIKKRLGNLLSVKSLVTLSLTIVLPSSPCAETSQARTS